MAQQLYYLEDRISRIEEFTGIGEEGTLPSHQKLSEKLQETVSKLPKDHINKYEKIKKAVNSFNRLTDDLLDENKIETVQAQEEQLNEIAQQLQGIDQLAKYLNIEQLFNLGTRETDARLLQSTSRLEYAGPSQPLKPIQLKAEELSCLSELHQRQFQQLALLNCSVIESINQRLKAIDNKISQKERRP